MTTPEAKDIVSATVFDEITERNIGTIYGIPVTGIDDKLISESSLQEGRGGFASISCIKALGEFIKLPASVILLVPSAGENLSEEEKVLCPKASKKWSVLPDFRTLSVTINEGRIIDLLAEEDDDDDEQDEQMMLGPVSLSGGISLYGIHRDGNKVCSGVRVHAKLKLYRRTIVSWNKALGEHCMDTRSHEIVIFDESISGIGVKVWYEWNVRTNELCARVRFKAKVRRKITTPA